MIKIALLSGRVCFLPSYANSVCFVLRCDYAVSVITCLLHSYSMQINFK